MNSIISLIGRKVFKNFYLCLIGLVILTVLVYKHVSTRDHNRISPKALAGLNVKDDHFKRDWHDYRKMHNDQFDQSRGAHGQPAELPKNADPQLVEAFFKEHGYNGVLSDKIPPHRSLPDIRPRECLMKKYLIDMPLVSIIIPVYNEHMSVIMRTIESVLQRAPSELIKEILIVDDGSSIGENMHIYLVIMSKYMNI